MLKNQPFRMTLFSFFKRKKKSKSEGHESYNDPSHHQLNFAHEILKIIGPAIEKYGFVLHREEIKKYSTTIIWRKENLYIKANSTTYPTDYPPYYNIILGEGNSEEFFEYDWNSVPIWALARVMNPDTEFVSYEFPNDDKINTSVRTALDHLLEYGRTFLEGDLTIFYSARKMMNKVREPYKIHSPDKKGKYQTEDEPRSAEQKNKFSK